MDSTGFPVHCPLAQSAPEGKCNSQDHQSAVAECMLNHIMESASDNPVEFDPSVCSPAAALDNYLKRRAFPQGTHAPAGFTDARDVSLDGAIRTNRQRPNIIGDAIIHGAARHGGLAESVLQQSSRRISGRRRFAKPQRNSFQEYAF